MKILVTGGAGYVGSWVVPALLEKGNEVRVLDNLTFGGASMLPFFANPKFELIVGDVADRKTMEKAVKGVDMVIHLAAIVGYPACRKYPELSRKTNVEGMRLLCEVADKNTPILFASTGSTYGKLIGDLCTETTPLNPLTSYGEQKKEAEEILTKRGNYVIYRFATAYGVSPRMRLDLLPNDFTYRALRDKTLIVYEKNFMRTFIHVRDMAKSFVFATENYAKMKNEVYNVGDENQNLSKEAICKIIQKYVDYYLHFADVGKDFDQRDYVVSYEKIRKAGFTPSITIDEGIKEMVKAMQVIDVKNPYSNV
ncbi:MAG: NAD(P)-dependent oxidoreductase [Candidatus Bilamarchaeaceae archaeon]